MIAKRLIDHLPMKADEGRWSINCKFAKCEARENFPSECLQHRKLQYDLYGAKEVQKYPARKQKVVQVCTMTDLFSTRRKAIIKFELPENTTSKWTAQVNETTNRIPGEFEVRNRPRGSDGKRHLKKNIWDDVKERHVVIDRDSMEKFQSSVTKKNRSTRLRDDDVTKISKSQIKTKLNKKEKNTFFLLKINKNPRKVTQ